MVAKTEVKLTLFLENTAVRVSSQLIVLKYKHIEHCQPNSHTAKQEFPNTVIPICSKPEAIQTCRERLVTTATSTTSYQLCGEGIRSRNAVVFALTQTALAREVAGAGGSLVRELVRVVCGGGGRRRRVSLHAAHLRAQVRRGRRLIVRVERRLRIQFAFLFLLLQRVLKPGDNATEIIFFFFFWNNMELQSLPQTVRIAPNVPPRRLRVKTTLA